MGYKILVISVSFLLLSFVAKAQDRIITTNNDTIHCRILEVNDNYIHYVDYQQETSKIINAARVAEYMRGTTTATATRSAKQTIDFANRKRWRVGVQFGGAYLLGSPDMAETQLIMTGFILPNEARDFVKKYRHGINFAADVHYMFNDYIGLGLKYLLFHTSANLHINRVLAWSYSGFYYAYFDAKTNHYVNYIAPSLVVHGWLDKHHRFGISGGLSVGYANLRGKTYNEGAGGFSQDILTTSHIFGNQNTIPLAMNLDLSFEYYILRCFSLGVQAGLFFATFDTFTISGEGIPTQRQALYGVTRDNQARVDYSLVARLHF